MPHLGPSTRLVRGIVTRLVLIYLVVRFVAAHDMAVE